MLSQKYNINSNNLLCTHNILIKLLRFRCLLSNSQLAAGSLLTARYSIDIYRSPDYFKLIYALSDLKYLFLLFENYTDTIIKYENDTI